MIADLFISAFPRFLLLLSIFKIEEVPGTLKDNNAAPVLLTSHIADPSGIPLLDALITEVVVHITHSYREKTSGISDSQYFILATILKVGFVAILGLCSAAQAAAARCIREYTMRLERLREDALSPIGHSRRLSAPSQMSDSDLEDWEEYRDTADEKAA